MSLRRSLLLQDLAEREHRRRRTAAILHGQRGAGLVIEPMNLPPEVEKDFRVMQEVARRWFQVNLLDHSNSVAFDSMSSDYIDAILQCHDYALSTLASCGSEDFAHVGLWLGYGRLIGAETKRLERSSTLWHSNVVHFALMSIISRDVVTDPWAFADKLRDGPGWKAMSEKGSRLAKGDIDRWRTVFADLVEVIETLLPSRVGKTEALTRSFREILWHLNESEAVRDGMPRMDIYGVDRKATIVAPPSALSPTELRKLPWPDIPMLGDVKTTLMMWGSEILSRSIDLSNAERAAVISLGVEAQAERSTRIDSDQGPLRLDTAASAIGKVLIRQYVYFGTAWALSGFPILRPTHKLSASLMASHIPSDQISELTAPFPSFFVEIPEGLVPDLASRPSSRVGIRPRFIGVLRVTHGQVEGYTVVIACDFEYRYKAGSFLCAPVGDIKDILLLDPEAFLGNGIVPECGPSQVATVKLLLRLLVHAIIETDSPDLKQEIRKGPPPNKNGPVASGKKAGREKGAMPKSWNIELRREVKLDTRRWVGEYIASGGKSPSVQTLVRGHRKRQPYGPRGLSLKKWIHVEPYWRGDEDAPIVVRAHVVGAGDDGAAS